MNTKTILGISLAAILVVAVAPVFAEIPGYLDLTKAEAREKAHPQGKAGDIPLKVEINVAGDLPIAGEELMGVGVFLIGGDTTAIVSTTHAGAPAADSITQSGANDPVWHNHFVVLDFASADCNSGIAVAELTWESPGLLKIDGGEAKSLGIPLGINQAYTSGTDGTTAIVLNTGSTAGQSAVSFTLTAETNNTICVNPVEFLSATD